jgi:hypothetical protein
MWEGGKAIKIFPMGDQAVNPLTQQVTDPPRTPGAVMESLHHQSLDVFVLPTKQPKQLT